MVDFLVKENGRMDVLLPGAALRDVMCQATLEDWGAVVLTPGEVERGEGFVRVLLTNAPDRSVLE